jgi:oxygen-dependent protoporphyrinogen oxidase
VAVVGGGISGLATAYFLGGAEAVVLEAGRRLGGKLWTVEVDGVRVEAGADSFVVRKPWATDLCRELGLEDRVVIPAAFGAFVWTGGRLVRFMERTAFGVPARLPTVLHWEGVSPGGRLRALADLFRPRRKGGGDESLASLLRRRFGEEASRVMVEPLLAGLHAGDATRLSVAATFPELAAWERDHGSLVRGAGAALRAAERPGPGRKPMFATLWGGLGELVDALEAALGPGRVRRDAPVAALAPDGPGWAVDAPGERLRADAVVLATPAFEAARLLAGVNPEASGLLGRIPYASTAVVALVYPEGTAGRVPEGTGYVVPAGEGIVTACTWVSRKWPVEGQGSRAVLRCFVGRAGDERALALPDGELVARVRAEVERAVPVGAEPAGARVVRWERSMPQYEVGHVELVDRIEAALEATPGVFVTGSAYRGVGIADCIGQARATAARVAAYLSTPAGAGPVAVPAGEAVSREEIGWTR